MSTLLALLPEKEGFGDKKDELKTQARTQSRVQTQTQQVQPQTRIPVLLYHRLGPVVADSMTITTADFESHLKYLKRNGYTVIPLRELVDYYLGKVRQLPPRAVAIVADDGHKSVYTYMLPLVKQYHVAVTLFIYPSAISNASYAMTWNQLREIKETGLFDFQSHTYWHPNFKREKKRLAPKEYEKSVDMQLKKSKEKLEKELGVKVDMLAWPFGIYDDNLIAKATEAGYVAGFSIERRYTSSSDNVMALPRFLINAENRGKSFENILTGAAPAIKVDK
ncbi:MAG: polysaccharide deacetylase family protein [Nitrospirae bacterium]|nr:polysaccharide deacetylase family protein [Nitrospirota bacterium]